MAYIKGGCIPCVLDSHLSTAPPKGGNLFGVCHDGGMDKVYIPIDPYERLMSGYPDVACRGLEQAQAAAIAMREDELKVEVMGPMPADAYWAAVEDVPDHPDVVVWELRCAREDGKEGYRVIMEVVELPVT